MGYIQGLSLVQIGYIQGFGLIQVGYIQGLGVVQVVFASRFRFSLDWIYIQGLGFIKTEINYSFPDLRL